MDKSWLHLKTINDSTRTNEKYKYNANMFVRNTHIKLIKLAEHVKSFHINIQRLNMYNNMENYNSQNQNCAIYCV